MQRPLKKPLKPFQEAGVSLFTKNNARQISTILTNMDQNLGSSEFKKGWERIVGKLATECVNVKKKIGFFKKKLEIFQKFLKIFPEKYQFFLRIFSEKSKIF